MELVDCFLLVVADFALTVLVETKLSRHFEAEQLVAVLVEVAEDYLHLHCCLQIAGLKAVVRAGSAVAVQRIEVVAVGCFAAEIVVVAG